jgi:hypothetical protein
LLCLRLSSSHSYLAGCCIASHPQAPPIVEPRSFGWLLCCLPSAGVFTLIEPLPSVMVPPPLSKHPPLLSSCCLFLHIRLLTCPSNVAGCHVASHLPALLLVKPLLLGWLLHCLLSACASASHWVTAFCCSTTSPQQAPPLSWSCHCFFVYPPLT